MKKTILLLVALLLCTLLSTVSAEEYTLGDAVLTVENGIVTELKDSKGTLSLSGIYTDVGCDGAFLQNTIGYQRFWDMNTWDLATIVPKPSDPIPPENFEIEYTSDTLRISQKLEGLTVHMVYEAMDNAVKLTAQIQSNRPYVSEIQGVHFQLRGIAVPEETTFQYPGNTPGGIFTLSALKAFATRQTDYCNPVTLVRCTPDSGFNALFLDTEEKWSTGVYRDRDGLMYISFLAMAEALIQADETITVGSLYLQTTDGDPYSSVQALYQENGYHVPSTAYQSGPLYSCHPAGTMDSGFMDTKTMRKYAESLPGLAQMGIESIWVLPIFEHTGRGVYEPTDQRLLDPRYGTDEDVLYYSQTAHDLGIKVLFDYVPHGPYPEDKLAIDHGEWCSMARNGIMQIEWECVSFDMANPDYQDYTTQLIKEHVSRFAIDGGRIDCAMGGLSNWSPQVGNRASSSSLKGGMGIVEAIRSGFEESGVTPLLLPENFHPVPFYAEITDVFYDMPLYKMMVDLRDKHVDETTFAASIAAWLESEHLSSVPGQLKLRFLGNHDTVSWTWDQQRATAIYGEEKAKALWVLMSTIDGVPFIYMGDENSDLYHFKAGFDLRDFFTGLFSARKAYLTDDMDIQYLHNDTPVIAFLRENQEQSRLVLVNLGKEAQSYTLPAGNYQVLYGTGTTNGSQAELPSYGYLMLDLV